MRKNVLLRIAIGGAIAFAFGWTTSFLALSVGLNPMSVTPINLVAGYAIGYAAMKV